ncbi:6-carboxytetrahydropterin synthase [Campylobacter sp. RM9344]|uniref:6-carboxy-5,6,7,8-tetrahydropterin synthase n=1 Tax=Campylobacter californiensis TaxID=1032243 RepID=A0AAW3ZRK8_9BACT|nr:MULTISPECIES: 6-carboxytetrahydropterin synthase [unclassified Campylobacter]MBE2984578.1 6-carboxytetrahydropterin synthase [Campylobacter sp. RM6883]MBE2987045.1 6-carboxytetrahydropterin synthase [Campylobacter sp. RM12919]MBE2988668.1 6-carboxytetrahydropterin synthase [Campylobacter sp. RM12920]MBE2995134.1 6-carboxytetrahydropterin synthase [Campylobacter sp. RM6913]MBE3029055.1 6-carboxytetrahydropterin synthase [Campylobacter sp. RM9344]
MIIRKLFKFENAHIVRFCSSKRCRTSIHGHSYVAEILLSSNFLDNAGMVYDFGLMKQNIKTIIDSFDHATTIYDKDDLEYQNDLKKHSQRWISIPVNPSAEQFCRVFFVIIDRLLKSTVMSNGEREVKLHSVIVHETDTGYAQCFYDDAYNERMGDISLDDIVFSPSIIEEWEDKELFEKIKLKKPIINPKDV